jgi:hypothetical protein
MSPTATPASSVAEKLLQRSDRGGVATLTLNRPKQYNALSQELLTAPLRGLSGGRRVVVDVLSIHRHLANRRKVA